MTPLYFTLEHHTRHRNWLSLQSQLKVSSSPNNFRKMFNIQEHVSKDLYSKILSWASCPMLRYRPRTHMSLYASPGSTWNSSDPVPFYVGVQLEEAVSNLLGKQAYLSYTGTKTYTKGIPLLPHRDLNGASEYLLSWTPFMSEEHPFLLYLERIEDGVDIFDTSNPEQALLFAGEDLVHKREPTFVENTVSLYFRYTCHKNKQRFSLQKEELCRVGESELFNQGKELLSIHTNQILDKWHEKVAKYPFQIVDVLTEDQEMKDIIQTIDDHGEYSTKYAGSTFTSILYNPPEAQSLLQRMRNTVIRITGIPYRCENTFLRKSEHGATLEKHIDRENLDATITFPLTERSACWPFMMMGAPPIQIPLGKGIFLYGRDTEHWRDPCEHAPSYWLLLHYRKI